MRFPTPEEWPMRIPILLLLLMVAGAGELGAAEPPHVDNGELPRDGRQVLELTERWHRGHDDDDLIFGAINTVATGPDGNIYVLDQQQSQVFVFDGEGTLLRILSREGEGPGESRRPEDMVFFADGTLGLAQYINGKIIRIDLQGTPLNSLMPPGFDPSAGGGGLLSIRRVRYRAGTLVINGAKVVPADEGMVRTQYLVRCSDNLKPEVEYVSRSTAAVLMRDGWIEKNHYFPSHERWDIDGLGRVLAAAERNEYRITVFEPDGEVAFTFGRKLKPLTRTEAEKQEIRDSLTVIRDGERVQVEVQVEDDHPAVAALFWMAPGEIWVRNARSGHDQEPGIMLTFDVFDTTGVFVRQVAIACEGDPDEDKLIFLGKDRVALVRGAVQARRNTFGGSRGEEEDVAMHDLKIFSY
jgi:hypothetical protein